MQRQTQAAAPYDVVGGVRLHTCACDVRLALVCRPMISCLMDHFYFPLLQPKPQTQILAPPKCMRSSFISCKLISPLLQGARCVRGCT